MTLFRAVAAACVVLVLTGCTAGDPPDEMPAEAALRLSPHGDEGRWLDPAYAAGIGTQYVTMNEVCAVTKELAIEVQHGAMGESTVMARALDGGAVNWQLEDSTCGPGALLPAAPDKATAAARQDNLLVRTGDGWRLIDPVTSVTRTDVDLGEGASAAEPLTWAENRLIVRVDVDDLVGVEDGREAWRQSLPARAEVTVLADGHAGVTDFAGHRLSVIDLVTGESTMSTTVPDPHWIRWAGDGYVQKVQETDPEYAYFDLDGREVDRTKGVSQYPFVPGQGDHVTFDVEDHRRGGTVVGVSAQGVPALFADERQRDFTQAGEVEELPDSIISLQGVSVDGSLLLFGRDPDGLTLLDAEGAEVAAWPLPVGELRIESGRIVVTGGSGTWVLLPAPR
ncbi:hypothetical protein DFO66_105227 [Brevibacterium sanguinis]|uniref:Pyrroloquinoline-quinone binding quinoprotein n=2 Tax=Brevibacterium TaxID=1696 RepID=A0A366IK72_9MICO|nr:MULTISPECIES: hypothetical protein [Brevibacterium]RBP65121.1 hypothetical protein DFO66_105227 [Brevibacterium sanguinis]RBP71384.1 hypothetical protein DFO65_106227 [Brevibacterium celere]